MAKGGFYTGGPIGTVGDGNKGEVIIQLDVEAMKDIVFKNMMPKKPLIEKDKEGTIISRIFKIFQDQTNKGLEKYGHTLDDCPDDKFDWNLMAMEEMADCIQYLMKKNIIMSKRIAHLERMLNPDE